MHHSNQNETDIKAQKEKERKKKTMTLCPLMQKLYYGGQSPRVDGTGKFKPTRIESILDN